VESIEQSRIFMAPTDWKKIENGLGHLGYDTGLVTRIAGGAGFSWETALPRT